MLEIQNPHRLRGLELVVILGVFAVLSHQSGTTTSPQETPRNAEETKSVTKKRAQKRHCGVDDYSIMVSS